MTDILDKVLGSEKGKAWLAKMAEERRTELEREVAAAAIMLAERSTTAHVMMNQRAMAAQQRLFLLAQMQQQAAMGVGGVVGQAYARAGLARHADGMLGMGAMPWWHLLGGLKL